MNFENKILIPLVIADCDIYGFLNQHNKNPSIGTQGRIFESLTDSDWRSDVLWLIFKNKLVELKSERRSI